MQWSDQILIRFTIQQERSAVWDKRRATSTTATTSANARYPTVRGYRQRGGTFCKHRGRKDTPINIDWDILYLWLLYSRVMLSVISGSGTPHSRNNYRTHEHANTHTHIYIYLNKTFRRYWRLLSSFQSDSFTADNCTRPHSASATAPCSCITSARYHVQLCCYSLQLTAYNYITPACWHTIGLTRI
jgi:hypothetical protein